MDDDRWIHELNRNQLVNERDYWKERYFEFLRHVADGIAMQPAPSIEVTVNSIPGFVCVQRDLLAEMLKLAAAAEIGNFERGFTLQKLSHNLRKQAGLDEKVTPIIPDQAAY